VNQRLVVRLWLLLGFLATCLIFFFRANLKQDYIDLTTNLKVRRDNLIYSAFPDRTAFYGIENKKIELKVKLAPVFDNFTVDEWQDFWQIIYKIYPELFSQGERIPPYSTQLTIDEIKEALGMRFPYPFTYFDDGHWKQFFKILRIKKK